MKKYFYLYYSKFFQSPEYLFIPDIGSRSIFRMETTGASPSAGVRLGTKTGGGKLGSCPSSCLEHIQSHVFVFSWRTCTACMPYFWEHMQWRQRSMICAGQEKHLSVQMLSIWPTRGVWTKTVWLTDVKWWQPTNYLWMLDVPAGKSESVSIYG